MLNRRPERGLIRHKRTLPKPITDEEWEKINAFLTDEEVEKRWQKTKEEWDKFRSLPQEEQWAKMSENLQAMQKSMQREQREKAAWMHERDPRYDPMTGDLLLPDELPLSPCEYTFYGKTRARSFVHQEARSFLSTDSPLLNHRQPVHTDGKEEEPESPYHERLIQRLLKAGFVEVEPTLRDKAHFEHTQWFRSLSASEQMHYLDEAMREMRGDKRFKKKTSNRRRKGYKIYRSTLGITPLTLNTLR